VEPLSVMHTKSRLLALPTYNNAIAKVTNTLAYYNTELFTTEKSFIVQPPAENALAEVSNVFESFECCQKLSFNVVVLLSFSQVSSIL
jgi:hypothetical protein